MTEPQQNVGPLTPRRGTTTGSKVRLVVALALFAGWLGWLGYTTLMKGGAPVVSRAQVAGMVAEKGQAVVAVVGLGPDEKPAKRVRVTKTLTPGAEPLPAEVEVPNLPGAQGFEGPGEYLLLLAPAGGPDHFRVIGRQPSPGYPEMAGNDHPMIYRWSSKLEAEVARLFP